jgi:D-cysteine desulfhydrase family pyridoxal phosphate-dependent enzyme
MSTTHSTTDPGLPRRFPLAFLPTPVERLSKLSKYLGGPDLWIKRDDQTGLGMGGNKTRKLEFLVADALARGADTLITAGAAQSNHCRQTAAAAARAGLHCELVLGGEPGSPPTGNLLLDRLFGAHVHWTGMERRGERMEEIARKLEAEGQKPYVIPYGGSNAVGAAAYAVAMTECMGQLNLRGVKATHMVVASSSGGTQAGLCLGAKISRYTGKITGVSIDKGERGPEPFEREMAMIAKASADWLRLDVQCAESDFHVDYRYLGAGYGVLGDLEREAILLAARQEGILLDPVYTGRAFGALLEMIRNRELGSGDVVVFWHTGGTPALFAYAGDLLPSPY